MFIRKYIINNRLLLCIALTLLFMVICCSWEKRDWEKAESENTIESYEEFINSYPQGEFTKKAHRNLEELYFKKAKSENTLQALKDFLKRYPEGRFAAEVHLMVQKLCFKFTFEVLSTRVVEEVIGADKRWEVKEPSKFKGVIVSIKLNLTPESKEIDTDKLIIAFKSEGEEMKTTCSGLGIFDEAFWEFSQPGSGKRMVLHFGENAYEGTDNRWQKLGFLFAVPIDVEQISFVYKDVNITKPIQIKQELKGEK